jgi:hypothetical protein
VSLPFSQAEGRISTRPAAGATTEHSVMHSIIYLIGLVVVIAFILSLLGLT